MLKEPINIGVIGVGHLGQHHVKHYKSIEDANLIGIFDIDNDRAEKIGNKYDVPIFQKIEYLLDQVDAVSIVTPTPNHIEAARQCINKKKHVFIEKPITVTLEEADELLKFRLEFLQNKVLISSNLCPSINSTSSGEISLQSPVIPKPPSFKYLPALPAI